ncbi:hypothetical protein UCRNP2_7848 [Neofusicoccum parvum UCRNP2]|uniref:Uncharacterized protein n=1 Tax=Botryosphaeria parva (strain UCR-NP2) TaxID=1287680 RepID=R1ECF1_BOTPV|nr:hypothetical protein UCRNP2_7848 [Neofusicoccum parvum UCRNP2]
MTGYTTYIRLALYGDDSRAFVLPTQKIKTYSELSKSVYDIFEMSPDQFHFDLHLENVPCEKDKALLADPRLWDLGMYFSDTLDTVVTCYVHFIMAPAIHDAAARALLTLDKNSKTAVPVKLSANQQLVNKTPTKRARSLSGPLVTPASKRVQVIDQPATGGEEESLFVTPNTAARQWASKRPLPSSPSDSRSGFPQSSSPAPAAATAAPPSSPPAAPVPTPPVTVKFRFRNAMRNSHGVVVADWAPEVPGDLVLSDYEDEIKNHITGAFLAWTGISQRQAGSLCEALEIKLRVEYAKGDALRERRTVEEWLVGGERVLSVVVEMCRRREIEMDVLGRLSPTRQSK